MLFGLFGKKKEKEGELIGKVVHFFPHVKAAVIKLEEGKLSIGNTIRIKGHTTNFEQKVESMQVDHKPIDSALKNQEVAIQVRKKTRRDDKVFILS